MKLRIKIPLIYTILIIAVVAAFIVYISTMVKNHTAKTEQEHLESLTKTLALNSANAIVLKDYAALRVFVDNISQDVHVRYVIVMDENGSVLSHSRHALEGKILEDPVSLRSAASDDVLMQAIGVDIMDVTAPLMIAGKKWGAVRVGFSLHEMKSKAAKARNFILLSGLITIFLGGAAAIFIAKKITDPIHKLRKGTEIIGEGNLDYRVDISTGDEIEQLATAFNTMTTELQKHYLAIESGKKQWEETFDAISDPLFIHDREFKIIRCNRAYAETAGMPFKEVIGKPYYEVFPKMEGPMESCRKALETQEEGEEEIPLPDIDKTYNAKFYPVSSTYGKYLYSLHILEDITEKKKAEEALMESEEKFRSMVEATSDWVWAIDQNGVYTYVSPKVKSLLGYEPEEVIGKTPFDLMPPEEAKRVGQLFQRIVETRESFAGIENTNLHKNGQLVVLETSGVSIFNAEGNFRGYQGIDRDITDKKKVDEELHNLFVGALTSLDAAIEAKSPWTKGHSERVMKSAFKIGKEMGLADEELEELRIAALLHDIGKIGTYDEILDKPEKLTDEEYEIVKRHPKKGVDVLLPIRQLAGIIPWIRGHHERYDGRGYPDGLKGEEIPLQARILAVADTFDSMTAERPYRETPDKEKAVEELKRCSGTQFDSKVVEAFLRTIS